MKTRQFYNMKPSNGYKVKGKSLTVPNESLTIREIIIKSRTGYINPLEKKVEYQDDSMNKKDPVEVQLLLERQIWLTERMKKRDALKAKKAEQAKIENDKGGANNNAT